MSPLASRNGAPAGRRLGRLAGAALAFVLLLAACGGSSAGGDPGGKRLHELAGDPVFAALPSDAVVTRTPAVYRKPGFSGGGWHGPSVVASFRTPGPPADVYGSIGRQAAAAGWSPTAVGALGLTDRWAKTYRDGAPATLFLASLKGSDYRLSGAIAPVVR